MKTNRSLTSYIEDCEEDDAKDFVEKHLGFPPIRAFSKEIAVKIYVRPEEISTIKTEDGRVVSLYLPPVVIASDKFRNCTALVIDVAKDCYMGEEYQETGPFCKVGDWVMIPRNVGTQNNYRGIPIQVIPMDAIYCVVEDPTYVERLHQRKI